MEWLIGIAIYIVAVVGLALFGRFLKDCDKDINEKLKVIK